MKNNSEIYFEYQEEYKKITEKHGNELQKYYKMFQNNANHFHAIQQQLNQQYQQKMLYLSMYYNDLIMNPNKTLQKYRLNKVYSIDENNSNNIEIILKESNKNDKIILFVNNYEIDLEYLIKYIELKELYVIYISNIEIKNELKYNYYQNKSIININVNKNEMKGQLILISNCKFIEEFIELSPLTTWKELNDLYNNSYELFSSQLIKPDEPIFN